MNGCFIEGEIAGLNAVISLLKHDPSISIDDLGLRIRSMIDQFSTGLSDDVKRSYLIM